MKFIIHIFKTIFNYIHKNITKKQLIMIACGCGLIVIGILSWNLIFSKYYIFNQQEKKLEEAVKNYYFYHPEYLPKNGMTRTVTLEKLYAENRIEELRVPNKKKLCDVNSWVTVYNDNGNYIYSTYLSCGKYQSNVDHEGPVITLNGDSKIYVSYQHDYKELGVKEVVDDQDGKIDVSKVTIDNSKVNTEKIGKYEVTYSVKDKANNKTKITRTVYVTRNLTDIVEETTGESNYYTGDEYDNYILFSGMMYRIIKANEDGTVLLISSESLNNLRMDYDNYENSNVDKYLNKEYLGIIHNQDYLVDTEFCVGNIDSLEDTSNNCSKKIKRKVALLDTKEFYNTFDNNKSYLCDGLAYALSTRMKEKGVIVSPTGNNCLENHIDRMLPAVRPVITLKKDVNVLSGTGTYDNPYKLGDYSYGKIQDKLSSRLPGEYINYSENVYRIMNIDKDNNVTLISMDGMYKMKADTVGKKYIVITVPDDDNYVFNVKDKNNPGYLLNNEFIDYINDSYVLKKTYEIPKNVSKKDYTQYNKTKVSAKIVLPKTYDLFAGRNSLTSNLLFLYLDQSGIKGNILFMNSSTNRVYDGMKEEFDEHYYLRTVMTIKGNLKIKSGKGTITKPYYVR